MLSTKMRTFCWEYYNSLIKVLLGNNIEYLVSTLVLFIYFGSYFVSARNTIDRNDSHQRLSSHQLFKIQ